MPELALPELVPAAVLSDLSLGARTPVRLRIVASRAIVRVQVSRSSLEGAAAALDSAALPQQPGTTLGDDPVAWWLAPNGWLVSSDREDATALRARLQVALRPVPHAVVDVSDALVTFVLEGACLPALLARGTAVDLASPAFATGRCLRTRLVHGPAVLRPVAPERLELIIDRAGARQVHEWLADAACGLAP